MVSTAVLGAAGLSPAGLSSAPARKPDLPTAEHATGYPAGKTGRRSPVDAAGATARTKAVNAAGAAAGTKAVHAARAAAINAARTAADDPTGDAAVIPAGYAAQLSAVAHGPAPEHEPSRSTQALARLANVKLPPEQ